MAYTASIDRRNPGCFLFLVDQSSSMNEPMAGQTDQLKMNAAADAVNRVLDNLAQRCSRGMEIRDYFELGVLGYGHKVEVPYDENTTYYRLGQDESAQEVDRNDESLKSGPIYEERIVSVLPGTEPGRPFLPVGKVVDIAEVEDRELRESDGSGGILEVTRRLPVWLRPHAGWQTPMCRALRVAEEAIGEWVERHPDSYPPMVINISDGAATDGDPVPVAQRIMDLRTNDGNVLMFNCHLSGASAAVSQYPDDESLLGDQYARQMYQMSSILTPGSLEHAWLLGLPASAGSRCCVFNADMVALVQFLDIGTRGRVEDYSCAR